MLYSSSWPSSGGALPVDEDKPPKARLYGVDETAVRFPVETEVQGDILLRCRHLGERGIATTMFRAAFHTG